MALAPGSSLPLDGLLGDLQQALEIARDAETPAPLSALARELWATARLGLVRAGDHTRLVRRLENVTRTKLVGLAARPFAALPNGTS